MPYLGTFEQALPYTVEAVGSASAAVLITSVSSRSRLEVDAVFIQPGGGESHVGTIKRGTQRLTIEFSGAANASVLARVTQAGNPSEFVCDPDGIAVIDVRE